MAIKQRPKTLPPQERALNLRAEQAQVDLENRTVRFPFSSDAPVDMWYGTEILSHAPGAMRNGQRQASMPLLFNHNRDDLLGISEGIELDTNRGYATVRFGKDQRGEWAMQQVADNILINASFMYRVYTYEEDVDTETLTATDWEPYEVSLVTVPADASVGVGRAANAEENAVQYSQRQISSPAIANNPKETPPMKMKLQDPATDGLTGGAGGSAVDIVKERANAAADERKRIDQIEDMCRMHKVGDELRRKMVKDGVSIEAARGMVLDDMIASKNVRPLSTDMNPDWTDKERQSWSLIRAVKAAVSGNWKEAGFEREVSVEIAKRAQRDPQSDKSFFMPTDISFRMPQMGQRAIYQVGTAAQGGNLVATNQLPESFIEVLRNNSVTGLLGATFLPGLVGKVDIPRQNAATATYWVGESGAVTEGEATFDKVSLTPKTVGALSKVSRLMLLQSTPAIEMISRRDLLMQCGLAIDLAALSGSGASNQPTGIVNTAGVGSVVGGTNGANLTFDHAIQLLYTTKVANAPQARSGFALNSKSVGYLSTQKSSTGQYLWDAQGGLTNNSPDRLKGRPYAESQQLRSNLTKGTSSGICSEAIYGGDWQELLIGEWGVLEIMANPYDSTGFANGDVVLRAFQTIDIGVRHGASFAVMSDALTPGF